MMSSMRRGNFIALSTSPSIEKTNPHKIADGVQGKECSRKESVIQLEEQMVTMEKVMESTIESLKNLTEFCKTMEQRQLDKTVRIYATLPYEGGPCNGSGILVEEWV